jgi:hypothetical protein
VIIAGAGFAMMALAEAYRRAGWAGSSVYYMLERGCICRVCRNYEHILDKAERYWLFRDHVWAADVVRL